MTKKHPCVNCPQRFPGSARCKILGKVIPRQKKHPNCPVTMIARHSEAKRVGRYEKHILGYVILDPADGLTCGSFDVDKKQEAEQFLKSHKALFSSSACVVPVTWFGEHLGFGRRAEKKTD